MDFCGSYRTKSGMRVYPFNCWADWDGEGTRFGGAYDDVPPMPSKTEPSEKRLKAWIRKHWDEKTWLKKYNESLKNTDET